MQFNSATDAMPMLRYYIGFAARIVLFQQLWDQSAVVS